MPALERSADVEQEYAVELLSKVLQRCFPGPYRGRQQDSSMICFRLLTEKLDQSRQFPQNDSGVKSGFSLVRGVV